MPKPANLYYGLCRAVSGVLATQAIMSVRSGGGEPKGGENSLYKTNKCKRRE